MEKQVKSLVELSGLDNRDLKNATVKYILKNGVKRPISKLINLVGHPCAQEQIQKDNIEFKKKYQRYEQQGMLDEMGLLRTNKEELIDSYAQMMASIIGEGFDIAFKDNLQINSKTGQVVVNRDPITGQPDSRFIKCASAEIPLETPVSESDPYKGSQQGLGKTRKHKKRGKKTLRRRKMRRNMH